MEEINKETRKKLLYTLKLIRAFEEKAGELYAEGKISGFLHLSVGEEAVPTGAISVMGPKDYLTSTHRGHGELIARGGDIKRMMAELFGKKTGYCKGKGGSMHMTDIKLGHLGANGIVGGGIPIATGAAAGIKIKKTDQVVLCFFGDGAVNTGAFHEALNLAGIWKLPVIYICENNFYAMSVSLVRSHAVKEIYKRASAYNMPGVLVDGMDVEDVREKVQIAIERARKGEGPTLIEAQTYRYYGHSRTDPSKYRTKEEEEAWKKRDPIKNYTKKLKIQNVITDSEIREMDEEIEK
ncbi:MAG TPA: thiamine pyrophosphate-dependent dehydrogenase E1 component subunit alpha, partial [Candidatus Atribacteria bacterium]|nr:thiamine pyrophosphate-dependent dehydrogenase E1 component subunit alpha [Candidatus Atribacteria bacterium]